MATCDPKIEPQVEGDTQPKPEEETKVSHAESDDKHSPNDPEGSPSPRSNSPREPLETYNPQLNSLARTAFEKLAEYLQGELAHICDDYSLLEEMNKATISKYSDMKQITGNVAKSLEVLNEKYTSLQPYLQELNQIEESVTKLEQAAYKLDAYSKKLEAKLKSLEKK
ncbi:unnamed protein product [Darwinula stevensoni]|uniref:Biogenesis of lysosome-related organelles complex 1 subunit 2 n=1 Tax=Darwinula stevensoni TaxID=69355 RepID=A0A7R9FPA4_9CRUS|nr:unnamed protein product [Darwinula stevensoni]CAG0897648.1 unnamed protein product [Darwinula stevensoni]